MPVELHISIDDQGVRDLLKGIQARFNNLTPAMKLIGETVQASIQRNFEVGGRPQKWADLSAQTKARRAKKNKWPGQVLVVSGIMKRITYQADRDGVTLTAGSKYAATHHFGARKGQFGTVMQTIKAHVRTLKSGKRINVGSHKRKAVLPWGDIPARPFMMVQKEDWPEIHNVLTRFLTAKGGR
jgi:phage gpG-like protein